MFLGELLSKTSVEMSQALEAQLTTLDETRKIALAIPSLTAGLDAAASMTRQILQLMSSLPNSTVKVDKINQGLQKLEQMARGK